jgi:hypothetical protein
MKQLSSEPTDRRDVKIRLEELRVEADCPEPCTHDVAARITEVVNETARIREALEEAATELSKIIALTKRVVFMLAGALSLLYLVYLIFVKDWHPGGIGGLVVSVVSIAVLLGHCVEITRRILRSSPEK